MILNKRFFTNTHNIDSGRQNYLSLDHLEDPLFTSFTFEIDFITSPLFYTIDYSEYGYPKTDGMCAEIEDKLAKMRNDFMFVDMGYDILPVLSAFYLDDNKLGFGLQQNVYMDMPLYGATEYIYMVDKRNGTKDQSDVSIDSNRYQGTQGNPNVSNSYKLGDSIKSLVNESDRAWAQKKKDGYDDQIAKCDATMEDESNIKEHESNRAEVNAAKTTCDSIKETVEGVEYDEAGLVKKVDEYKKFLDGLDKLKRDIISWTNDVLKGYQTKGNNIYASCKVLQALLSGNANWNNYDTNGFSTFANDFINLYNEIIAIEGGGGYSGSKANNANSVTFLIDKKRNDGESTIRDSKIIDKFKDRLKNFDLIASEENKTLKGSVTVACTKNAPEWIANLTLDTIKGVINLYYNKNNDYISMAEDIMTFECNSDVDAAFSQEFTSDKIEENERLYDEYDTALTELRTALYGWDEVSQVPRESHNPDPDSPYGQYVAAKEKFENDVYSQAEKTKAVASSGSKEMGRMLNIYNHDQKTVEANYNDAVTQNVETWEDHPWELGRKDDQLPPQTVLDMIGFITGMKKMIKYYPYIIQGITGLDVAYNKHYGIKDPYLGSGTDKITLTCLESLDLRVSSMFNRYFNAVYDRQYRRERVPVNLRRFNCSVYVHDTRHFKPIERINKDGDLITTYNRILELTDMYYSVIEFRFYDCEIVPEETGNIFNDISNEAPSEMKKTNFTFTYGNCVVNFVPPSEVEAHNVAYFETREKWNKEGQDY